MLRRTPWRASTAALALALVAAAGRAGAGGLPIIEPGAGAGGNWSGSPRVEVDNLQQLLASPAAAPLLAEHPELSLIAAFDRDSNEHCYVAGAMDEYLTTDFESTPSVIRRQIETDPAATAAMLEIVARAYRRAIPRAAAAARRLARRTMAAARDGSLDEGGLQDTAARLKLFDLYGRSVTEDEAVAKVREMAAAARSERTMTTARRIASRWLSERPQDDAAAPVAAGDRIVAVRFSSDSTARDMAVLQLRYGLRLVEKRADGTYLFELRDGASMDETTERISFEEASVESIGPLASPKP